jgi:hypothetical protein
MPDCYLSAAFLCCCRELGLLFGTASLAGTFRGDLELVAKLTFEIAMRDDGTSQQHERFMRGAAHLFAHPQLPELMEP